jgi:thioesterase domain-containing protein
VRQIAKNQPLLGIEARGVDGRAAPFVSIPQAARHYVELLLSRQPLGPYYLGGPSFGGNLAFEMAQLLTARGHEVGMVALFDAHGPNYPRPVALPQRLENHLAKLRAQGPLAWLARAKHRAAAHATARVPEGDSALLHD